jgi:hypothetical protein
MANKVVLFLNAQSILGKIDQLCRVACEKNPDLISVAESWCHVKVTDAFLRIHGYELQPDLRRDRTDTLNRIGGGLLVYTRIGTTVLLIDRPITMKQFCCL